MRVDLELLSGDKIGVRFPYDALFIGEIRQLGNRRWNRAKTRWEVHLAHLPDLIRIFNLTPAQIPGAITKEYKARWSGPAKVRAELDVLEGRLSGGAIPIGEIDDETSFFLPGHKFSPKYQAKQWDGKRHLFSAQSMKFPAGLWPRIRKVLERNKIEFEATEIVEAERESTAGGGCAASHTVNFSTPRTALRNYQAHATDSAMRAGRGIIQIATGGGKTLLAAHLIHRLGKKTLFFVHTRELLHQTAEVFGKELGVAIGRLGDGRIELADITVATVQTAGRVFGMRGTKRRAPDDDDESDIAERPTPLKERKDEIASAIANAGVVIFDECHHVPAETFYKIAFQTSGARFRFGLSATPWRDDGHDLLLEAALGEKICAVTCSDLIEAGFLVAPQITMERSPRLRFIGHRPSYPEIYQTAIVENQARNRVIAERARAWSAQGRSVLVLVAQIEHGRRLQELMPEAQFAYGNLETETRRQFIADLERKLHPILIATTLADEGLDIPSLDALILAGGGKSDTKAYQRIGRALRPSAQKTCAYVMDFFDNVPYLQEHSLARLGLYRLEPRWEILTKGFQG